MDRPASSAIEHVQVIAEIANTHEGDPERAEALVRAAARAGADIIKFQYFKTGDLVGQEHPEYSVFRRLELSEDDWKGLFSLADSLGIEAYADVFGVAGVSKLESWGCTGFKVHSSDITNLPLLDQVGATGRRVLLALGAATPRDAWFAAERLQRAGAGELTLMLGFQAFPTALEDTKLANIGWYRTNFGLRVGYSDHVDGADPMSLIVPQLAVSAGAQVIEKHLTIGRDNEPEDYEAAIEPDEFSKLVLSIRHVERAVGLVGHEFTDAEAAYGRRMKKYPLARRDLEAGTRVEIEDIIWRRLEGGADAFAVNVEGVVGRKTAKQIRSGDPIRGLDIEQRVAALLAVRSQSTRLPGKAFASLGGRPAIVRLIERLHQCRSLDDVIVCTTTSDDDNVLASLGQQMGIKVFRGSEQDVMGRFIAAAEAHMVDIIVRVTGDDILTDPEYLDRAVELHRLQNAEYTCVTGLPIGVDREVISTRALRWVYDRAWDVSNTEYMTWYLDDSAFVHVARLEADPTHSRPDLRLTLDTSDDLELMSWLYEKLGDVDGSPKLKDVIKLLDRHPEKAALVQNVALKRERDQIDTRLRLWLGPSKKDEQ